MEELRNEALDLMMQLSAEELLAALEYALNPDLEPA